MHARAEAADTPGSGSRLAHPASKNARPITDTRVAACAQGVVEAGWLVALLVVPLFFSPLSDRMFEPAKVAVVRTLAGVMCAAWLVRWLASGAPLPRRTDPSARRNVLALPALLLLAANAVGTATSLSPAISLMGAYDRAQGLYTTACYLAIFFLAADGMRSLRQVERAVTVALVASFAVALYALLQHIGLDPLPRDPTFPAGGGSTLGNPAFLGGYLAMTAPLALARLMARGRGRRGAVSRFSHGGLYGLLLAVQVSALLLSGVRGAALGLLGGLCLFLILHASLAGRRAAAGAALAATLVLVSLAALRPSLASPDPPEAPVTVDSASTAGHSADPTAEVRVQVWEAAVRLSLPHAALRSPEGSDRLNAVRPLVGYGPDSFYAASGQVLPRELGPLQGRTARPDHAHNEPLNALAQTGVPGLLAYLLLLGTIFYLALASLGWIRSGRERRAFAAACAGGALLVPAIAALTLGRPFIGVAVAAGIGIGMLVFLFAKQPARRSRRPPPRSQALLVALVAALTAHLVETQVSVASTTARTYFWILAAALVVVSAQCLAATTAPAARPGASPHGSDAGDPAAPRAQDASVPPALRLAVVALLLATLAFGFVTASTLAAVPDEGTVSVLFLFVASTAVAIAIGGSFERAQLRSPAVTATVALVLTFAAVHLYTVDRSEAGDLSASGVGVAVVMSFMVVFLVGLGAALAAPRRPLRGAAPGARVAGALAAGVLLTGLSSWLNIRIAQADVVYEQAPTLADPRQVVRNFRGAVAKQPLHDRARALLADAHLQLARVTPDPALRERELARAERALRRARELNPFDPDHTLELAVMHETAAGLAASSAEAEPHFERSRRLYRQAIRMSPGSAYIRDRHAHALLDYARLETARGDAVAAARLRREARRQLDRALSLDRDYCLTLALRARTRGSWRAAVSDALTAVDRSGPPRPCGGEGLERRVGWLASRGLARAAELAVDAGETAAFLERLRHEVRTHRGSERSVVAARARRWAEAAAHSQPRGRLP